MSAEAQELVYVKRSTVARALHFGRPIYKQVFQSFPAAATVSVELDRPQALTV